MAISRENVIYPEQDSSFVDLGVEIDEMLLLEQRAFERSLLPVPETEEFRSEMGSPVYVYDDEEGIKYGVYQVNKDIEGKPLVMNMSWSVPAGVKTGRNEVKAYASRHDGPITVIDMEGHGETEAFKRKKVTFDDIAAAHIRIINQLGIEEFDVQGMSMGGVVATKIAEQAGSRVGNLATVSTVSFEKIWKPKFVTDFGIREARHQVRYMKDATPEVQGEVDTGFVGDLKSLPTLLRLAMMMTNEVIPEAVRNLDPSTNWYDFVGSKEEVTGWRAHLQEVRDRNNAFPGSSSLYVIGHETHAWSSIYLNDVARLVTESLKKQPRH